MTDRLLGGFWRYMIPMPRMLWQKRLFKWAEKIEKEHGFMSEEHHNVRNFVVTELPRVGKPLSPEFIARRSSLQVERVEVILDELEKHMAYLFRSREGAVVWAYPVTVEPTPHHLTFSSGEQVYAAWAADAFAAPFVQGRLRGEALSVVVKTECAHCSQPMHIEIDSDLNYRIKEKGADPIVFAPAVDLYELEDPSIIEAFWKKNVFFWSEEHAREYRRKVHRIDGAYLTSGQIAYVTPIIQGAAFGFLERDRIV